MGIISTDKLITLEWENRHEEDDDEDGLFIIWVNACMSAEAIIIRNSMDLICFDLPWSWNGLEN